MRSTRNVAIGAMTAALAAMLAACGGPSSEGGTSAVTPKTSASVSALPRTGSSADGSAPSHSAGGKVCAVLPAAEVEEVIGIAITETTDLNLGRHDPLYCDYETSSGDHIGIGVGTPAESADAWARIKKRNRAQFTHDLGGDEAAIIDRGMYLIHKGDELITFSSVAPDLDEQTLRRLARKAAAAL